MDGEVIVHSQGAVGEVKHIALGLFQISLSCGCDCVFWLLRFRLCARWTLTCCFSAPPLTPGRHLLLTSVLDILTRGNASVAACLGHSKAMIEPQFSHFELIAYKLVH